MLLANAIATTLTLDELVAQITAAVASSMTGELVETVTVSGVAGRLYAYHFRADRYEIDVFAVADGHAYELSLSSPAGTEAADLAFVRAELQAFWFGDPGF